MGLRTPDAKRPPRYDLEASRDYRKMLVLETSGGSMQMTERMRFGGGVCNPGHS